MASGLLSLKWNNHRSTFFHVLSSIRSKESYCDATLACDGRFYPVHKLVLSTCSEYFEQIFERTQCKHPVIVLKDIKCDDLEALMNYMYVGEVNVLQEKLAGLIKAAECLKIKGLAVPDEDPVVTKESRRNQFRGELESSPHAKRRRRDDNSVYDDRERNTSRPIRLSQRDHHQLARLENQSESTPVAHTSTAEAKLTQVLGNSFQKNNASQSEDNESDMNLPGEESEPSGHSLKRRSSSGDGNQRLPSLKVTPEGSIDETSVKTEPPDIEDGDEVVDSKEALHSDLGFDPSADGDSLGADGIAGSSNSNDAGFSDSNIIESTPQTVEDVVAQAIPSSSNFQGNSFPLWEGEGSLQNFPGEGFSGENSQGRQMVGQGESASENTSSERSPSPLTILGIDSLNDDNDLSPFTHESKTSYASCGITSSSALNAIYQQGTRIQFSSKGGASVPLVPIDARNKGFQCSFCKKSFPIIPIFIDHLSTHNPDSYFTCPLCDFRGQGKETLKNHILVHTDERTLGRRALTDEYSMSRKPFACNLCPYRAFNRSNLTIHMRMHTGEKPFACNRCPYRASHKGNLVTHMRVHTGSSSNKQPQQHVCQICNRRFNDSSDLQRHSLVNHPSNCPPT